MEHNNITETSTSFQIVQRLSLIKAKEESLIDDDEDDVFEELHPGTDFLYEKILGNQNENEDVKDPTELLNSNGDNIIDRNSGVTLLEKIKKEKPKFEEEVNVNEFIYNLNKRLESGVDLLASEEENVLKVKQEPLNSDVYVQAEILVKNEDTLSTTENLNPEENYTVEGTTDNIILKEIKQEKEFEDKVNVNDHISNFDNGLENLDMKYEVDVNEFIINFDEAPEGDIDFEKVEEDLVKFEPESLKLEAYVKEESTVNEEEHRRNIKTVEDSNKNIQWYYCAKCTYRAKKKHHIQLHVMTHPSEELKRYSCEHCSRKFTQKQKLACHVLSKHRDRIANEKTLLKNRKFHCCPQCNYATLVQSDLKKHLLSHGETAHATKLSCQHCKFSTYNKSNYTSHLRVHSNYRQFICTTCNKGFNRKSGLDGHILQKHKNDKELLGTITSTLYKCGFCSMSFIKTTHLDSHVKGRH